MSTSSIANTSHGEITRLKSVSVDGVNVFYRQAGSQEAPVLLLLHGFPSSSHMYRNLMTRLSSSYQVIAPDMPGFGFTSVPAERHYVYSFESLTNTIDAFTQALGLSRYALYVFDYGAPVGFRLAMRHPNQITAIISQNGNAYEEGLGSAWAPFQRYWREPTHVNREALREALTLDTTRWAYTHGLRDPSLVAPETFHLDASLMARPGNAEVQLDLFKDYASNVALYPAFQAYFRQFHPPMLAIWGQHDELFVPAGAKAFTRDNPRAQVELLDAGHFALETHCAEIAVAVDAMLAGVAR